jgi:hypothetical protein
MPRRLEHRHHRETMIDTELTPAEQADRFTQ